MLGADKMASRKFQGKSRRRPDGPNEAGFLAAYDPTEFERPSVSVDVALLSVSDGHLLTLVLERTEHPSKGLFALPGGFVGIREPLEVAAARVLADKAGLSDVFLEQLYTFGDPLRDPRTRVITVAYYALVDARRFADCRTAHDEARVGRVVIPWEGETGGSVSVMDPAGTELPLAFDHEDILGMAVKRLRGKLDYTPVGFQLLPPTFTLFDLQSVHEAALGQAVNKDSFRRRMLASGQLEATGTRERNVGHRPAELYRFRGRSAV
jgi:8-oxo-dGTP diphosphatase